LISILRSAGTSSGASIATAAIPPPVTATVAVPNAARTGVASCPMGMGTKDQNSSWAPTLESSRSGTWVLLTVSHATVKNSETAPARDAVEGGQRQQDRRRLVGQEDEGDAALCEAGAQAGEAQDDIAPVAVGDTSTEEERRDHRDQGRGGDRGQPDGAVGDLQHAEGQGDQLVIFLSKLLRPICQISASP
jgi:hypothetical protein